MSNRQEQNEKREAREERANKARILLRKQRSDILSSMPQSSANVSSPPPEIDLALTILEQAVSEYSREIEPLEQLPPSHSERIKEIIESMKMW